MSDAKKSDTSFLVQGSILAIASIISRIVGLVYRIPLTAIIGKTGNDYYGTAYEIYNIILIISSYSIPLAVSKLVAARMARGEVRNSVKVLKGSLLFAFVSGGSAMLIVYFCADFLTGPILQTPLSAIALRVLAPVLMIVAIVGVFRGFFQGLHTMLPSAVSQILEQLMNAVVSIVAAYMLFSYGAKVGAVLGDSKDYAAAYGAAGGTLGTAIGALVSLCFVLFIYFAYSKRLKRKIARDHNPNQESYREITWILLMTIIPVLLSTTIYNISSIIDQIIFKHIVLIQGYSAQTIHNWWGVYTGQFKVLINVPISIASAIAASSVPSLTKAFANQDRRLVKRQIHSATRFIMMIAFPCTVGLIVLAGPINMLLFGDSDPTSARIMILGGISVLFYSLSTLTNGLLQGINRLRIPVRNAFIALIAQCVLLLVMLEFFDLNIYAVVLANAFYAFFMCALNGYAIRRYSGCKQNIVTTYLLPGVCSVIMGLCVYVGYLLFHMITHSNFISTIISILIGIFVYFVVMLLFGGIRERDLERIPKGTILIHVAKKMRLL